MVYQPPVSDTRSVYYPDSDGQPMADNTKQFRWIVVIKEGLEAQFDDRPDVFVAGDLLWYPVEGNPKIRTAPDAMVVFGRPKGDRGSYKQWVEDDIPPQVVFEVLSPGNTKSDMEEKFAFYDRYGVEEYYLYDPDAIKLQGWQRVRGTLEEIKSAWGWTSPRLEIRFEHGEEELELIHPDGNRFETFVELNARANQEKQRAEQERQRAERLAARLRTLGIDPDLE